MSRRAPWAVLVVALATLSWSTTAAGRDAKGDEHLSKIGPAPEFTLTTQDNARLSLRDLRGRVVVVTFIYASCTDTCPLLTAKLASLQAKLGTDFGQKVFFASVTVDPERDTPEVLAKYVPAFDPGFLGLTGDDAAIRRAAQEFKIFYEKRAGLTPSAYTVDHSAQCFVIDPAGRLRLFVRNDRIAQDLAEDLRAILAEKR